MIITKIIYFILIIISILFYMLFIGDFSLYLMVFILSIPILFGIIIVIAKFNIKLEINSASLTSTKNEKCKFILTIKNNTIFPFSNSRIQIVYKNKLSGIENCMEISVPIHPLTEEKLYFYLSSDYCGILNVKVKSIKIYDYIKLFSCKINPNKISSVYIMPDINLDYFNYYSKSIENDDSETYSNSKSGDDPSEIFELKEYISGDNFNRIHWKLSLIHDKFITKHFSQPTDSAIVVIPDLILKGSICSIDTAIEIFYAVSLNLLHNSMPFEICCYNKKIKKIEYIDIINFDSLISTFIMLMDNLLNDDFYSLINKIEEICLNKSEVFFITNNNGNFNYQNLFDDNSVKNLIIVNDSFSKSQFKYFNNLTIAEIPSGKFHENIEKILK